jgi:hypothetical protein
MTAAARIGTLTDRHGGPVVTAFALGLVSIPAVSASAFASPPAYAVAAIDWRPIEPGMAILLAAWAVLPASVVGGWLGGRLVLTRPAASVLVAIAISWPLAIALLPIGAAALAVPMEAAVVCIDACTVELTYQNAASGLEAYSTSVLVGMGIGGFGVIPAAIAGTGWWMTRRSGPMPRIIATVVSYAAFHFWSILYGAIPFLCLSVGAVAWSRWLGWRSMRTGRAPAP